MEAVHQLWNASCEIPPVDVEQVDVISLQLLQTGINGDSQTLRVVALEVGLDLLVGADSAISGRKFGGNHHLIAILALLHPLADPGLGFLALVFKDEPISESSANIWQFHLQLFAVSMKLPPFSQKKSNIENAVSFVHSPIADFQFSPKFIAPG